MLSRLSLYAEKTIGIQAIQYKQLCNGI